MSYLVAYLLLVILFAVTVWAFEAIFIVFAVISKNRAYINLVTSAVFVISYIYELVLAVGAFFWLWDATNLVIALVISFFIGGIFYGLMAGVFGAIIRLPVAFLVAWAEGRVS